MIASALIARIEEALLNYTGGKTAIKSSQSVGGGCINKAFRISTSAGDFFVKENDGQRFPGMFAAEASGLKLLASARAVKVPEVIHVEPDGRFIILEWIEQAPRITAFWENFGRALAQLHRHSATQFGLEQDNYIGSLPQSNKWHPDWISFFIHERLEQQAIRALQSGKLAASHAKRFEMLYARLPRMFPPEAAALLHGDLWSGNVLTDSDGSACLIDPAVYFGNREMEIAFTRLFGGFDERFYAAYREAFPLQPGFDERKDLCNLYPLLVHVNLFGGSYAASIEGILSAYS